MLINYIEVLIVDILPQQPNAAHILYHLHGLFRHPFRMADHFKEDSYQAEIRLFLAILYIVCEGHVPHGR